MMFSSDRVTRYLVFTVVAVSALVMGYILLQLLETKQNFAIELMEQSTERVESELDEFFLPIENTMMTLKRQQEIQFLQDIDTESLNQYFIPIIDQYPQISSIGVADSRGYEINVLPDSTTGIWLNREVFVEQWGMIEKWTQFNYGDTLFPTDYWESELAVDPRERAWFTGALEEEGESIYWTEPYIYMTGQLGLTSSVEWKTNDNDTLRHILALDITLQDITQFSKDLSTTENNQVFILTNNAENIIGLPQNYASLNSEELIKRLMSTPAEFGNVQLNNLLEEPRNEIVNFESERQQWWGILKPYQINSSQELHIAILLPESDFAGQINRTRNAIISGFLLILILSLILVRSHNEIRKISWELNEKNKLISDQKERLFSEVHHRVKNNLAVMMALMDIENMESEDEAVKKVLSQTQSRIRSMSTVHEILYKSDDMNRVDVQEFIPGIVNFSTRESNTKINSKIDVAMINVNQALTYSLLINEFITGLLNSDIEIAGAIMFEIDTEENKLHTKVNVPSKVDFLKRGRDVGKQLIEVLITQLEAEMKVKNDGDKMCYQISFILQNKKGSTSNNNYTARLN